jgi:hypothetical protein
LALNSTFSENFPSPALSLGSILFKRAAVAPLVNQRSIMPL